MIAQTIKTGNLTFIIEDGKISINKYEELSTNGYSATLVDESINGILLKDLEIVMSQISK